MCMCMKDYFGLDWSWTLSQAVVFKVVSNGEKMGLKFSQTDKARGYLVAYVGALCFFICLFKVAASGRETTPCPNVVD